MAMNFPFWDTLSEEVQTAYRIAEQMMQTGRTIGQVSWRLTGSSWSPERLLNGLSKVTQAMSEYGVSSAEAEAVIAHGTQAAAATAGAGAGAGIVTRFLQAIGRMLGFGAETTAATLAGAVVITALLAGITWGVASYLGSRAGDAPVQPGSRSVRHISTGVQAPGAQGAGPYYIYVLDIEPGGSIYIGGKTDVQRPGCQFVDGGLCQGNDPNVGVLATIGGSYETYDQAVAAYCSMVTDIHSAYGGTKGYINGQDYWLDNAPACSA